MYHLNNFDAIDNNLYLQIWFISFSNSKKNYSTSFIDISLYFPHIFNTKSDD